MSELQTAIIDPLKDFATKSIQLVKKCTKPNRKGASARCALHARCHRAAAAAPAPRARAHEVLPLTVRPSPPRATAEFTKIASATSVGFLLMGFIGFFVKLIHIPINNIIVGGG